MEAFVRLKKVFLWLCILFVVLWTIFDISNRPTQAQGSSAPDNDTVISKLENILSNQRAILDGLASIKEELRIIKIRITQQQ